MLNHLGKTIKELRQSLGYTQKEFAKDICSQSQISKIENGEISPYVHTLVQMALKLGVEPGFLIDILIKPQYAFIQESRKAIRKEIRQKNYKEVRRLVNKLKNHPSFKHVHEQQFIKWHEGILHYYLNDHFEHAILHLDTSLAMSPTNHLTPQDIEILNSKAIIYCEANKLDGGIAIFKNILKIKDQSFMEINPRIIVRVYYNLAKSLYELDDNKESLFYCNKGVSFSLEIESFYLLGELYFQSAVAHIKQNNLDEAHHFFQLSKDVFQAKSDSKSVKKLDDYIKDLKTDTT
ncbi:helix-turn-helix domain-containing protein [Salipaludibacillus agaradhaerens]|jgi:transcriptional regulator with XRE-family HTH domain|uniref:helix-turn-helix domain-containing protein n=1 Tax=Salipaludibacillus agaradhaerens TaxID=76935 RepID=UPI000996540C|nr:helix-turn-helix domain-containing protein [Salipaludibacillus agaradhaerens]